jgi:hypothetical protein
MGWFRAMHVKLNSACICQPGRPWYAGCATSRTACGARCVGLAFASRGYVFAGSGVFGKRSPAIRCCSRASTRCLLAGDITGGGKADPGRGTTRPRLSSAADHAGVGAVVALTFRAAVTGQNASPPRRSGRASAWRQGAIDAARPIAPAPSAAPVIPQCGSRSSKPPYFNDPRRNPFETQSLGRSRRQTPRRQTAKVALARKIGVVLRRTWIDGADFRFTDKNERADHMTATA